MTIAVCYVSPEGIVFGADSTASVAFPGGFHYFNHNQKLFELGTEGTLAAVTWGLGGLGSLSHRTLLARLADDLEVNKPKDVSDVANRWAQRFWAAYSSTPSLAAAFAQYRALSAKKAFDKKVAADPDMRDEKEQAEFEQLHRGLVAGFCIGGYIAGTDRVVEAFEIMFEPALKAAPTAVAVTGVRFWGAPSMIDRLLYGCDGKFQDAILQSGHWTGKPEDLGNLIKEQTLVHGHLPIREAVDFVHACIYCTIKALKFSTFNQICGGPIELAVVTTDREFRWVRHKEWDIAITEGVPA